MQRERKIARRDRRGKGKGKIISERKIGGVKEQRESVQVLYRVTVIGTVIWREMLRILSLLYLVISFPSLSKLPS